MAERIGFRRLLVIGARVEPASPPVGGDGSTRAPMNDRGARTTVSPVKFADLRPPSADGPPRGLRLIGWIAMATVVSSTFLTDPRRSLHGDGPLVILGIIGITGGLILGVRRQEWWPGARFIGLSAVGISA